VADYCNCLYTVVAILDDINPELRGLWLSR